MSPYDSARDSGYGRELPELLLLTAPTDLPVTLDEAKAHVHEDFNDRNDQITAYITAATAHLDGKSGLLFRCLMPQTWVQYGDLAFPACDEGRVFLPLGPVLAVNSVKYIDTNGTEQTISTSVYEFVAADGLDNAFIRLKSGQSWPSTYYKRRAFSITFTAGYADADAVPEPIQQAILLYVGHLYDGTELSPAFDALLTPYKRPLL